MAATYRDVLAGCTSAVHGRARGTELKTVSGESERRGTVTIRIVQQQFGDLPEAKMQALFIVYLDSVLDRAILEFIQDLADLRSEESGDDSGRCLVRA